MGHTPFNEQIILEYIKNSRAPMTKREIARAFNIKGSEERIRLKKILKMLEDQGAITKQPGGDYSVPEGLPGVAVIEVNDISIDGDVFARPVEWAEALQGPPPRIEIMPDQKGHPALKTGDRVLARLSRATDGSYEGRTIKRLDSEQGRVMGLIRITKRGAVLQPTDKKAKYDFDIDQSDMGGGKDGDLAVAEIQPARGLRNKKVRIVEVIGRRDDPKAISLISLHESGINEKFPDRVIADTKDLSVPPLGNREDLRSIPLVTIDGADARDFDDAVFAEKTDEGFHLIVAIADVAFYVRSGTPLDNEAQKRGNSTYFPDRVVPMLPEALSNDLCSLRPHEPRACMAVHMWIDAHGNLIRHHFVRGLMKSVARLTYEQVQAAKDGIKDSVTADLMDSVINPLYEAFGVLDSARQRRGALDLDIPERQILIDERGNMTGVRKRIRLDSHKLIEEFMILANVCAATSLENEKARSFPCVYRIHDKPSLAKLDSAREFVETFGLSLPKGQVVNPGQINQVLKKASALPYSHLISQVILRSQSQAVYSTENIGHFGLALTKYAHFTSPIRRYADLLVHRALIAAYDLGPGGMIADEAVRAAQICEHITGTERTSMEAERSAVDRFTAAYLSTSIGAEFAGRISGVTRFGLFVTLHESGADGLVPMRSLPHDFYVHDEDAHALVGQRSGRVFRLGAEVTVRLMEADGLTGSTLLNLVGHDHGADIPGFKKPRSSGFNKKKGDFHKRGKKPGKPQKHHKKRR
jgi:ribonuclease R